MTNFILKTLESVENRFATLEDMGEWQLPCGCAQPGQRLECINCPHLKEKIAAVQESLKPQIGSDLPAPKTDFWEEIEQQKQKEALLRDRVLALHDQGHTIAAIMEAIGDISETKTRRILSSAGFKPNLRPVEHFRKYPLEVKQKCVELYEQGISTGQISRQMDVPTYMITSWANEAGLTQNPQFYARMKDVALTMFSEGKSIDEIAAVTNVKKRTLDGWLINAKVKTPKPNHSSAVKARAIEMLLQGVSTSQIGTELGVEGSTVRRWAKKANISLEKKVYFEADKQKCLDLYGELGTYQGVEEVTGISSVTIRRWVLAVEPNTPVQPRHSDELRRTCLELCQTLEPTAVAAQMGLPVHTIYTWQRKERLVEKAEAYSESQQKFCLFLWSEQSKSAQEIQAETEIELEVIEYWIKQARDCRSRGYSPEIRRQCLDLYENGSSLKEIEEITGVAACTVTRWAKFEGLTKRTRRFSEAEKADYVERCLAYRQAGKTFEEISQLTGVASRTLSSWLKELRES
ncbi:MAG: helix-turn-helix domain-containing protein [Synechocystis sp.]|nr:helix-turn-helix domain-containing protein [Synechocystis sp.]